MAAAHVGSVCSPLTVLSGAVSVDLKLCSLLDQVAYSVDAQNQLGSVLVCMIHAKPAVYRKVVVNSLFLWQGGLC